MALLRTPLCWLHTMFLSLAIASLALSQRAEGQCNIAPLALTWSNITVTQDGLGVTRGIELGVGSPHQIFAFRASTTLNNTRINNVLACGSAANNSCIGSLGGGFDTAKSKSYAVSIKSQWNGSAVDQESAQGSYVYFNDDVGFQSQGDVNGYPLVMESQEGGGAQSGLPLGTNSSFLRAAVAGGVAPSQVFGLWPGSRSVNPQDGLLVIGGYDRSRMSSNFTQFPVGQWSLRRACPLQVNIANLTFNNAPLMNPGDAQIPSCIEPSVQRFVFPPAIAKNFAVYSGQNSTAYPKTMRYNVTTRPVGDLVITLSNGYTSTITNDELFAPLRGSDKNGRYTITNDSTLEAFVSDTREQKPADVDTSLGAMFLTFNYLMVDYANSTFNLAPAILSKTGDKRPDLTTVCKATQNSPAPPASSAPSAVSKPLNTGAIAGGVVGGVAGLVLIAGLVFLCLRRRKKQAEQKGSVATTTSMSFAPTPVYRHASEMSAGQEVQVSSQMPVHELPTQRWPSMNKGPGQVREQHA